MKGSWALWGPFLRIGERIGQLRSCSGAGRGTYGRRRDGNRRRKFNRRGITFRSSAMVRVEELDAVRLWSGEGGVSGGRAESVEGG